MASSNELDEGGTLGEAYCKAKNFNNSGDHQFKLVYKTSPEPILSFAIGKDCELTPVHFEDKLVSGTYAPCLILYDDPRPQYRRGTIEVCDGVMTNQKRKREYVQQDRSFERLWTEKRFTDAVVLCGNQRFPVHRAVLCAKSRVFATLYEGPGQEAEKAEINMTGEVPSAVAALVEHVYTGVLPPWGLARSAH